MRERKKKLGKILKVKQMQQKKIDFEIQEKKKELEKTEEEFQLEMQRYHQGVAYSNEARDSSHRHAVELFDRSLESTILRWGNLYQAKKALQEQLQLLVAAKKKIEKHIEKIESIVDFIVKENLKKHEENEAEEYQKVILRRNKEARL
jgi:hypothetical protein